MSFGSAVTVFNFNFIFWRKGNSYNKNEYNKDEIRTELSPLKSPGEISTGEIIVKDK